MPETRALSLIEAYDFGNQKGLATEINAIRSMALDGVAEGRKSATRRGYVAELFREHGFLEEFIDTRWPNGRTRDGQARMRRCEGLSSRHQATLEGSDEVDEAEDKDEDATQSFALESQLRDYLANNLEALEPGMRLYQDSERSGIEYPVDGGRIDVLAIDNTETLVVIELKLSRGRNKALGQLLYYMGWVDENLTDTPCRGAILAAEISAELRTAVARVRGVSLYEYAISMTVEPVSREASESAE